MAERSIESIYNELVGSVVSQAGSSWSALKDSMVGRELLYAGANIISATERVSSSVLGVLDIGRYGIDQLVSYAYGQDVSLDLSRPGSVKVRVTGAPDVVGGVFAPFSLRMTIGILDFYNIDYCSVGDVITLYCGTPQVVWSGSPITLPFTVREGVEVSWRLYVELSGGRYRSSYLKLDESVMSSSVWVFAQGRSGGSGVGPVFPYTTYNGMLSDPDAKLYKVRRLWDYSTAVLFGDGNWAQQVLPQQYNYGVVWLAGNYSNFTVTRGVTLSYTDALGVVQTWGQTVDGGSVGFDVVSTSVGTSRSVSYARNYLVAEVFKTQGLVTGVQLENFVLSFPSVQSAYLGLSKDLVNVYVKPVLEGDTSFDFITDYLSQYGVSGVVYNTLLGRRLGFLIRLRGVGSVVLSEVSRAAAVLAKTYAYDNVTMSTRVSSSLVQQELSLQGIRGVVATLYGREYLSSVDGGMLSLASSAAVGSIRQYDGSGLLVGFDSEGRFKSYVALESKEASLLMDGGLAVSGVGDFWWISGYVGDGDDKPEGVNYLVSVLGDGRLCVAGSGAAFTLTEGMRQEFAPYGDGLYCLSSYGDDASGVGAVTVQLYRASSVFRSGGYSLFNQPSFVTPLTYQVRGDNGTPVSRDVFTVRQYSQGVDGVSVEVLRVLGASGIGSASDSLMCALRFGSDVYGVGVYRLGSVAEYDWDLVMMYGGSSESLVKLSAYNDGLWYMPVGKGSVLDGVGVYSAQGDFSTLVGELKSGGSGSAAAGSGDGAVEVSVEAPKPLMVWNKFYRLSTVDGGEGSLGSGSLVDWRITSPSAGWVLLKEGDSFTLNSMQFTLITKSTGDALFEYRFDRTYLIKVDSATGEEPLQLSMMDGAPVVYGAVVPVVDDEGGESAEGAGGEAAAVSPSRCWWVLPSSGTEMVRLGLEDASIVKVTGSVDYEQGIVYGLVVSGGASGGYVEYEVSSVLGGEGSYPYLLDIVAE